MRVVIANVVNSNRGENVVKRGRFAEILQRDKAYEAKCRNSHFECMETELGLARICRCLINKAHSAKNENTTPQILIKRCIYVCTTTYVRRRLVCYRVTDEKFANIDASRPKRIQTNYYYYYYYFVYILRGLF